MSTIESLCKGSKVSIPDVPGCASQRTSSQSSNGPAPTVYARRYPGTHLTAMRYEQEIYCYPFSVADIPFKPPAVFLHQHFDRSYTQFCIGQRNHSRRKPQRIDIFINPLLEEPFKDFQQKLRQAGKETRELFVFVGGTPQQLRLAVFNGLPASQDGIVTSMCVDDAIEKSGDGRAVMMCLALPGKQGHQRDADTDCWSMEGKPQYLAFKLPEQLLPISIITY
eukprot:TRINITY_DN11908_c0_g4_i1.p1 TRINITY_DN11908_c0_g4~~TRINITY_DN11908_c0_g4_i1.p1  ORF type:complete len:223 (+),score=35.86 TRINITY_DN11908_c0_g4_i1:62-730(+)